MYLRMFSFFFSFNFAALVDCCDSCSLYLFFFFFTKFLHALFLQAAWSMRIDRATYAKRTSKERTPHATWSGWLALDFRSKSSRDKIAWIEDSPPSGRPGARRKSWSRWEGIGGGGGGEGNSKCAKLAELYRKVPDSCCCGKSSLDWLMISGVELLF